MNWYASAYMYICIYMYIYINAWTLALYENWNTRPRIRSSQERCSRSLYAYIPADKGSDDITLECFVNTMNNTHNIHSTFILTRCTWIPNHKKNNTILKRNVLFVKNSQLHRYGIIHLLFLLYDNIKIIDQLIPGRLHMTWHGDTQVSQSL